MLLDWNEAAHFGPMVAGGKGAQLAQLALFGLPVGDGCVIPVQAYHESMSEELRAAALRACVHEPSSQGSALARVREAILQQPLPASLTDALDKQINVKAWNAVALAVRSSAPAEDSAQASFAGIHQSVLNVIGRSALEEAIRTVWASLWTMQAVAYRERMGIPHSEASMAVVLMPMVDAKASGVIFTCDPRTGREDRNVISSVRGLGEALVSGMVTGEDITLGCNAFKAPWFVAERHAATATIALEPTPEGGTRQRALTPQEQAEPVLNDDQALVLGALARDAADALNFSAPWYDIEWVWDGTRFHLVQARPITQRPWHTYPALQPQGAIWTNGNTRDVMPHVLNPVDFYVLRTGANTLLETPYRLAAYPLLPGVQRVTAIHGRAYLNVSLIQWEAYAAFGLQPKAMNRALGGHQPEIAVPPLTWRQKLRQAAAKFRLVTRAVSVRRRGLAESQRVFSKMRELRTHDLRQVDDAFLLAPLAELMNGIHDRYPGLCLMQCFSGSMMELLHRLERTFPGESNSIAAALLAGGEPSVTAQQGYDMIQLAQLAKKEPEVLQWLQGDQRWSSYENLPESSDFRAALETFLDQYGHRGVYESYVRMPRLRESPAFLLRSIAGLLNASLDEILTRQQKAVDSAWQRIKAATNWPERMTIRLLLRLAKTESNHRELARSTFIATAAWGRLVLLEIGRRLVEKKVLKHRDDVFHLTIDEHIRALRGDLSGDAAQARVAARIEMTKRWESLTPPEVIMDNARAVASPTHPVSGDSNHWRGVAIGGGYVEGKVKIIRDPQEQAHMQPGDILVAPSTDPSWVPLFLKAGGLIMETGGFLSHGAIVAREFGIPAVVNLPGILDVLRDGETVAVNGDQGLVVRLVEQECAVN